MRSAIQVYWYPFIITIITVVTAIITLRRNERHKLPHRFLALMFWSYWYAMVVGWITMTDMIERVPHLFRTGIIGSQLFFPVSYFYVRHTLDPARGLKWTDLFHLMPVLLYLVDYAPFWMLSGQEKLAILNGMDARGLHLMYKEGWLMPAYSHVVIRSVALLIYWIAQIMLIRSVFSRDHRSANSIAPALYKWLIWMSVCQFIMVFPTIFVLLNLKSLMAAFLIQTASFCAAISMGIYLLLHPEVLYGLENLALKMHTVGKSNAEHQVISPGLENTHEQSQNRLGRKTLSPEIKTKLDDSFRSLVLSKKGWLNPDYQLADLALDVDLPSYQVSAYLKHGLNTSFSDYVNSLRIDTFLKKVDSGGLEQKTLEALAKECGFGNRGTFIRVFKKMKGTIPSVYLKNQKNLI